ncbi:hypothetical protein [Tabrizicola soli]|uniref:Uncharacterized protein n=1 Tax=Tabrizicola soli TaxID=2185115 RepID=A0ABV7DQ42_9RHOB|nr:hypothetical protein [Tabrizicola soli]
MSIHSQPRQASAVPVDALYFQTDRQPETPVRLRPLTALEQMYAYWGSDRQ